MKRLFTFLLSITMVATIVATPLGESVLNNLVETSISASAITITAGETESGNLYDASFLCTKKFNAKKPAFFNPSDKEGAMWESVSFGSELVVFDEDFEAAKNGKAVTQVTYRIKCTSDCYQLQSVMKVGKDWAWTQSTENIEVKPAEYTNFETDGYYYDEATKIATIPFVVADGSYDGVEGTEIADVKAVIARAIGMNALYNEDKTAWAPVDWSIIDIKVDFNDGTSYTLDKQYEYEILDDGTVELTKYKGSDRELTIPSKIDGKTVTSIGEDAFYNCSSLTSITIPNSVTNIGSWAFLYCDNIKRVYIDNLQSWCNIKFENSASNPLNSGADLFLNNQMVTNLEIPSDVTEISMCTFYNCTSLTSVTIGNRVTSIGGWAFYGCSNLSIIIIPNSVKKVGQNVFYGTRWMDNMQKENPLVVINNILIDGKKCDVSADIPDKVESISDGAFYYNKSLINTSISNSVTNIGNKAFEWCSSLTNVTIGSGVRSIGDLAFHDCSNLVNITIPKSVEEIGERAFGYLNLGGTRAKVPNFKIKCYKDTAGEKYAKENGFDYEIIHEHTYTSSITKQPTCTATGVRTYKCSVCSNSYTETISATGHKYSTSWTTDKVATCTAEGSKSHHCTVCGAKKDVTSITKVAHKYDNGKITKQPTETATGIKTYTCTVCKTTKTESVQKLTHTHNYTSQITKQATCTATGVRTYKCSCGDSYTETIKDTGHKFSSWTTTKKATCKATGTQKRTCSVCKKSETKTIAKLKTHSYKNVNVNSTYFVKGYTGKKCSVCGTVTSKKAKALITMSAPKVSNISTTSLKLTWSKVKDAKGYEVYQNGKKIKTVSGTNYTVSKLKAGTTFTFTIKPYNSKKAFGNQSKVLKVATIKLGTISLDWSKVKNATGYQIQLCENKNFKSGVKSYTTTKTNIAIKNIPKGKKYYGRIRSYKKNGSKYKYSVWSRVKTVVAK